MLAKEQPFLSLRDVAAGAEADLAHISSVSRRLRRGGLNTNSIPAPSLNFTDRNKADRLVWCELMQEHDEDYWATVIFTDEKIFRTTTPCKRYVRRPVGLRDNAHFTATRDASGHQTLHVWGWIDGTGCGELHRIIGRHDTNSYIEILEQVLLPTLQAMRPGAAPFTLQHDNAPQHTARATLRWLADHREGDSRLASKRFHGSSAVR
ncbi:Transposable element Tcb2 transposase [Amphibalanus amphitrite]|uniref:Transposable element Tcb2 transposase n=1 Tax=Amphibalanus amphitrite TaxID=1232801 RepID=A0A6A4V796_AMPAM|nr:Transposable element Tcb2 transposase [Amphibalanus amphitrite]